MFPGFNTNGLAHHTLRDSIFLLAEIGYAGIAVTLDHDLLERCGTEFFWRTEPKQIRGWIEEAGLRESVVETGARFLLDPRRKHSPNLLDPDPEKRRLRRAYYFRAVELAEALGSPCVSLWSGAADPAENASTKTLFSRLGEELRILTDHAGERNVRIAFEPEPGMFVETVRQFEELLEFAPPDLCLTLDVGHLFCQFEPIADSIFRHSERLVNLHFEDSVRGRHVHLFPGEGEMDFTELFDALRAVSYAHGVYFELSRSSPTGPETAEKAFAFWQNAVHSPQLPDAIP